MRLYERGAQRDQLNYHYIKKLRMLKIKFEQNLVAFEENTEDYVSFFVSKAEQYLQNPVVSGIDFRDMLQSGDSFLTPEIIGLVYGYLEQTNFQLKLQALLFLNQFIQWADGEALALANEAEIDTIVQAVMRANSSEGNLASNFYPEVNGQE